MKVLITAPSLDERENVSGIATLVREIIHHGKSEFSHFIAGRKDAEKAGISWVFRQFILPAQFFRQIRREKPDLVHINTAFVPLSIMRDAALTFASKIAGAPVLLHPNGGRFLIEDFDNRLLESVAAKMLQASSKVLVLSEFEKENLTRRWKNLDIGILPNAIAIDKVPPVEKQSGEKTILFFGRIHESKGLHEIIKACEILKRENFGFRFNCFGTGPQKDFFIAEMKKVLGEKFFYGGIVSGKEKWKILAESDIFLLPSRYGEGLPLAMLEAMAARCVAVVADVASVRAVIEDGVNGFMVEPYNAAQTTEKLKLLLSDTADWQSLREKARRTVEEKFSIDDYVVKLENLYKEIIEHNRKRV
jgi:glycosyltransferase involved in cell wall biosynthesis